MISKNIKISRQLEKLKLDLILEISTIISKNLNILVNFPYKISHAIWKATKIYEKTNKLKLHCSIHK